MQFSLFTSVTNSKEIFHRKIVRFFFFVEQHRNDSTNLVQMSFDGIHRPVQSAFDGSFLKIFFRRI